MPTEPVMDEQHEALLRTACGITENDPLPTQLVDWYWVLKRAADRLSVPITERDLAWLILFSQSTVPSPPEATFMALTGNLPVGTPVEAKWRYNRWTTGTYQGITRRGMILVQLDDGTAEVREIKPESVRLAEHVEAGV